MKVLIVVASQTGRTEKLARRLQRVFAKPAPRPR